MKLSMSESMRKIIFYENIMDFKEGRNDQLTLKEVHSWQICRTCLAKTDSDDVDVKKMCVMDAIQGRFFNIIEMLSETVNIKLSIEENIASKVCKTCFHKITELYYFTIQVRKAEQVLKRMINNFEDNKSFAIVKKEDHDEVKANEPQAENAEQSIIIEVEELFGYTPDMENAVEIDAKIIEDNESTQIFVEEDEIQNCEDKEVEESAESKEDYECVEELFQEMYDDITAESNNENESEKCENIKEKPPLESEINGEFVQISEENEDSFSCADSFEELYITDAEYVERDSTQINDERLGGDTNEKSLKSKKRKLTTTAKARHIQPRSELPLLEELKCVICEQTFNRQSVLVNHVQDEHPNTKAYKCRFCKSAFSHIQSLSRHVRKHKSHLLKYTCQYCYREFLRADDLKRHIRTHTGERPYQCSYCDKAFKQQGEMKSHEETHLPKKTFYCTECPKTFKSRNGLYLHKRLHSKLYVGRKKRVLVNDIPKERVQISTDKEE